MTSKHSRGGLEEMVKKEDTQREARVLIIDIETSPIVAYTWGPKWETNIIEFIEQSQIIGYSAKWLNGRQETRALCDYKGYRPRVIDDKKIVKDIHALLDEADVVVTQNGVAFDTKTIMSRFLYHGLKPPSPFKNVDTKIEAKKYLRLPSYKLDDMGKYLNIGQKLGHEGFNLWLKCIAGHMPSWNAMKRYNKQDVLLTEQLYLKLRPLMKTHPNVAAFSEKENCPKCNSDHVQSRGYVVNTTTKYHRGQCQDCGGWFRYGKPIKMAKKPAVNT